MDKPYILTMGSSMLPCFVILLQKEVNENETCKAMQKMSVQAWDCKDTYKSLPSVYS